MPLWADRLGFVYKLPALFVKRSIVLAERRLKFVPFMKPQTVQTPPEGAEWVHDIKHDGYRTQLVIENGSVIAYSSSGIDWSSKYQNIVADAHAFPCTTAIIDGEIVANNPNGVSDFSLLPHAIKWAPESLIFMAFDLLHLDSKDMKAAPLLDRKDRLHDLISGHAASIRYSEHVHASGQKFFEACEKLGVEGMVSKQVNGAYRSGPSKLWVKTKCYMIDDYNVIGTKTTRTGEYVAILQSRATGEYAGVAFVNLKSTERKLFRELVEILQTTEPPSRHPKDGTANWLNPGIIASVRHLRGEESLRHASIIGVRIDPDVINPPSD